MPKSPAALYRSYGITGIFRLTLDLLYTRLVMPEARLLRRPVYLRGKHWMKIGAGFTTGPGLRMDAFPRDESVAAVLYIGRDVQLNDYVHIGAVESVSIGNRVLIASKVFISDHNHGTYRGALQDSPLIPPGDRPLSSAAVVIEDDVWLGEGVCVLPGVHIGRGAVIGAGSVVTRDMPANTIAVGAPARVVRSYNFETSQWDPR